MSSLWYVLNKREPCVDAAERRMMKMSMMVMGLAQGCSRNSLYGLFASPLSLHCPSAPWKRGAEVPQLTQAPDGQAFPEHEGGPPSQVILLKALLER